MIVKATVAPPHFAKHAANTPVNTPAAAPAEAPLPAPPGAKPGVLGVLPAEAPRLTVYQTASAASTVVPAPEPATRIVRPKGPWLIQVGAFPKEAEAHDRLREAQQMGKTLLARAEPFTEKYVKGSQEYYRARFDGLTQASAEAACKYFKRNEIACMAIKN